MDLSRDMAAFVLRASVSSFVKQTSLSTLRNLQKPLAIRHVTVAPGA